MIRRRRREGRTNYAKRIKLLKGNMPRLVVRKTNRRIIMQICNYDEKGDRTIAMADSNELKQYGWDAKVNTPTAYLTGMLMATKAKGLSIDECILDTGLNKPLKSSVVFAAAYGAKENGLNVRANIEFDEKRIRGEHIDSYNKSKGKETNIAGLFDATKKKIAKQ